MVRGKKESTSAAAAETNPETEERNRLKKIAFSNNIISGTDPTVETVLRPSKTVAKHHGADIIRRSQRKNRFLFSFPGLIGPVSGGKIGELKDLSSKNPVLYLHFPQGQMKLFGTIVYPKNRYLTLQFSRGGKNVMCEDYFDTMIVFSDAWWIGRKEDNPEEARLELPMELHEEHKVELDFKGGAGGASELKQSAKKSESKVVEQESPITDLEDDCSEGQANLEDLQAVTPTRHSVRTAGKRISFAEVSSEDDIVGTGDTSGDEDSKEGEERPSRGNAPKKAEIFIPPFNIEDEDVAGCSNFPGQVQKDKIITKSKEISRASPSSLVQTTISSLFKKVEDEKVPKKLRKSPLSKVAGQTLQHIDSGKRTNKVKDAGPRKKRKVINESETQDGSEDVIGEQLEPEDSNLLEADKVYKRKTKKTVSSASVNRSASRGTASKQATPTNTIQIDEDEIEEFSSTTKNSEEDEEEEEEEDEESDEDWAG